MKGKYTKKSDRKDNARNTIILTAAILKLINEIIRLIKNLS